MGTWTREELETAFAHYLAVGAEAGRSGDWNPWANLFTDDAVYVEHLYGRMNGREAIREWIVPVMTTFPGSEMPEFPIGWHVVDDERGWIVCEIWNRMRDPGDGSVHEAANFTLLKYAGDNRWSYEEDVYNPQTFRDMIGAWNEARRSAEDRD